jgi:multidrug resistance efflux pump
MRRTALLLVLLVAACSPREAGPRSGGARPGDQAAAVARGVVDTETGLVRVRAPRDGIVTRLLAEEGDHVVVGQALALIDPRQAGLALDASAAELAARRAQVQTAAAHTEGVERDAARLARLAAQDAAPRQDAEQAATAAAVARGEQRQAAEALRLAEAKKRADAYEVEVRTVRAPVAGKVARRDAVAGAFASAAGPLFLLEPDGRRVIRAELDEAFADHVKPGAAAVVTPEFQPGRSYKARVLRIADLLTTASIDEDTTVKADTRVVSVLLTLDDATDLRIGQRVLVRFTP